jgi:aminoglycoside phosphotransferase (APT) family kinase protein
MLGKPVTSHVEDPGLPRLAKALDMRFMAPLVARAAGLEPGAARALRCSADVLNHKPGRRCTIRYRLCDETRCDDPAASVTVVGKLFRSAYKAERVYRRIEDLGKLDLGAERIAVPATRALVPELGLLFLEYAEGRDLRSMVSGFDDERPLVLAAHWLARLHAAAPLDGLKVLSVERQFEKLDEWCEQAIPHLDAALALRMHESRAALHGLAARMSAYTPAMIHKDFYYAHVIWDGERAAILDFDQVSVGDPALDVGHFLAHFEAHAHQLTTNGHASASLGELFVREYCVTGHDDLRVRVPFYKAQTFLKLAATHVSRKRGDWLAHTRALVAAGCRVLEEESWQQPMAGV